MAKRFRLLRLCSIGRPLLGLAVLFPLAGCALLPPNSFLDPTKIGRFPMASEEYVENGIRRVLTPRDTLPGLANAQEPTPEDLVPVLEDYRIGAGDSLQIIIDDLLQQGAPYGTQQEVGATGTLRFPLIGQVRAAGLTEDELEREIQRLMIERNVSPNPIAQAVVLVKRQQFFTINGDVAVPGPYNIPNPDLRLLEAIGLARDVGATAKRLFVIRQVDPTVPGTTNGAPSAPAAQPPLVVPPPTEPETEQATFSVFGLAQDTRPADPLAPAQDRDALRQILEPPGLRPPSASAPSEPMQPLEPARQPDQQPAFRPLIFDPATNQPIESPPTAEVPPPPPVSTDPAEPFDWGQLPEYELKQRIIEIDLTALKAGDPRENIIVRNRDVLSVPVDTGVYYLMGEVNRPGVFAFGGREVTLKQAIGSIGGGLTALAWPQRVEIIRREKGTDKQLTIPVDLDRIFFGLDPDVVLMDDDVVNVGTHTLAPFLFVIRNSFRFTYGFGFVYDRNFADVDSYNPKINPDVLELQRQQQRGLPF